MNLSNFFLIYSLSFLGGVLGRSFFDGVLGPLVYVLIISGIILGLVFYQNKKVLFVAGSLLFLGIGLLKTDLSLNKIQNIENDNILFSGEVSVIKEPVQKEKYQKIVAKIQNKNNELNNYKILINTDRFLNVNYGDKLELYCQLKISENFSPDFDYRMYLAKDGIYYQCSNTKIENIIAGNNPGLKIKFYKVILAIRNKLENNINEIIPQPQAALANGLLFGGDDRMSKNLQEKFSQTGMTHIVAVSGYNVTILSEYLMLGAIFIGFWRKKAFYLALIGIWIFIFMIGFPASAIRAGIMGSLLLWAMKNGRLKHSFNALILAAVFMLLDNPLLLRWDIGFQLSFLAALGLIMTAPIIEKYSLKKYRAWGFTEILLTTLSAQIFVLPIIMYYFHILSIVSLPLNLLILSLVPVSMLLVFLTSTLALFLKPLALVLGWLSYLPLRYEVWLIDYLANFSWASLEVANFGIFSLILYYLILASGVYYFSYRN